MGVDFLAHFIGDGALAIDHGRAIGVQQRRVDVFMVEHQQAMVADVSAAEAELRVDREEVHAVVVHADLFGLVLGAVAGVVEESRITAADRGAPGYEGRRLVAGGHRMVSARPLAMASKGKRLRRLKASHAGLPRRAPALRRERRWRGA